MAFGSKVERESWFEFVWMYEPFDNIPRKIATVLKLCSDGNFRCALSQSRFAVTLSLQLNPPRKHLSPASFQNLARLKRNK
jgi:hypothetical protein